MTVNPHLRMQSGGTTHSGVLHSACLLKVEPQRFVEHSCCIGRTVYGRSNLAGEPRLPEHLNGLPSI